LDTVVNDLRDKLRRLGVHKGAAQLKPPAPQPKRKESRYHLKKRGRRPRRRFAGRGSPASYFPDRNELARHYEWRASEPDIDAALRWTQAALERVETWLPGYARDQAQEELSHRKARLERKRKNCPAPST
jgi:hypothetical protein